LAYPACRRKKKLHLLGSGPGAVAPVKTTYGQAKRAHMRGKGHPRERRTVKRGGQLNGTSATEGGRRQEDLAEW